MEVEVETRLDFLNWKPAKKNCHIYDVTSRSHLLIIRNIFINKNSVPTEYINEFKVLFYWNVIKRKRWITLKLTSSSFISLDAWILAFSSRERPKSTKPRSMTCTLKDSILTWGAYTQHERKKFSTRNNIFYKGERLLHLNKQDPNPR